MPSHLGPLLNIGPKRAPQNNGKLKVWVDTHNCSKNNLGEQGRNITPQLISHFIMHRVARDVDYEIAKIQADVLEAFNVNVSYEKAWHGKRKALESIHGDWETNIRQLPAYMDHFMRYNPGTKVVWKFEKNEKNRPHRTFRYVFWAIGPCVRAYQLTFPVVMVEGGTHLHGSYKGVLLVAVTKTANNNILPLAYALVDEESIYSWTWFLKHLRLNVLLQRPTCIISDLNAILCAALDAHFQKFPRTGWHRYCLRHFRNNLMDKFKTKGIKTACTKIGQALSEDEYTKAWDDMQRLNSDAWQWLQRVSERKWTLYKDGGHRWGNTMIDASEIHNNILKGCRLLSIKAIVNATLMKTVEVFNVAWNEIDKCDTFLPSYHHNRFMEIRSEAANHATTLVNEESLEYNVKTCSSHGTSDFSVYYGDMCCSCGVWQSQRFPCSHAMAVCVKRQENPNDLVNQFYTCQILTQQFKAGFRSVLKDISMVDVGWKLLPNYTRLSHYKGRSRRRM